MIAFYKSKNDKYLSLHPGSLFINVCPVGRILPFQFIVPKECTDITSIKLISCNKNEDILSKMINGGLRVINKSDYNIVIYPSFQNIDTEMGVYYLELIISGIKYYSEDFRMTPDALTKIAFSNNDNFMMGNTEIVFENFSFEFYTTSVLSKPEYTYEEEATQRGGYTFIESQVSKKVYAMNFIATEHLCDRLRLVKLCSDKTITDKKEYEALVFNFNPEWLDYDDLASVNIDFEVDNIIWRTGGYTDSEIFKRDYDNSFNQSFS